jgi:hypothetical protein
VQVIRDINLVLVLVANLYLLFIDDDQEKSKIRFDANNIFIIVLLCSINLIGLTSFMLWIVL